MNSKSVKKWWLATLIISPLLSLLIPLVSIYKMKSDPIISSVFENKEIAKSFLGSPVLGLVGAIIGMLILYYCAYRKPGTRLLSFCIIIGCISIPFHIYIQWAFRNARLSLNKIPDLEGVVSLFGTIQLITLLCLLMFIFWLFFSIQLRKVNRQIQLDRILAIPNYQVLFQQLQDAASYEELQAKYTEYVKENPSIYRHLNKKFKERSAQLSVK